MSSHRSDPADADPVQVVDLLVGQLPADGTRRRVVEQAVFGLELGPAAVRGLRTYLEDNPDALTSGRSDGPPSRIRLLNEMADRLPGLVARPQCVVCGRAVRLRHKLDGGRACSACYAKRHARECSRCGRVRPVERRDDSGAAVCSACSRRDPTRWEQCGTCGQRRPVAARPATGPLCQSCIPRRLYTCVDCGRPEQTAHAHTAAGPICGACYHRQRVAECDRCKRATPYARQRTDTGTTLCDSCWQPSPVACTVCGIDKPIKRGRGPRGTAVCESCRSKTRPVRECIECGKPRPIHSRLRMGDICGPCYTRLRNTPRACANCEQTRPLIGRNSTGERICGPCADEDRDWTCRSCGRFAALYADGTCPSCVAGQRIEVLCRNPAGRPHPQLRPLIEALDTEHRPREIISWLHNAKWAQVIKTVASQHDQITHAAFDEIAGSQQVAHARAVMVHLGILEPRDEEIDGTIPWLEQFLRTQPATIATIIRPYAMWSVLRRARRRVPRENRAARKYARSRIVLAASFLTWLDQRGQALIDVTQRDVDVWLTADTANRHRLRDFLVWAHARRLCAALEVPWQPRGEPELYLDEEQRRALLRACLQQEVQPLDLRAAATLVLLFGLTPTRIVQIERHDLTTRASRTYLTVGRRPMVLPRTVADLLSALAQEGPAGGRSFLVTAGDSSRWLFPGSRPGAHADASHLSTRLNRHLGLRVRNARNAAISALALDLPAPVLADLLGIEIGTAIRWTKLVKRDWTAYVASKSREAPTLPRRIGQF